jgi:hypothetical protein
MMRGVRRLYGLGRERCPGHWRCLQAQRLKQAEAAVDFLAHKFTNTDLYEWMSGLLARVY